MESIGSIESIDSDGISGRLVVPCNKTLSFKSRLPDGVNFKILLLTILPSSLLNDFFKIELHIECFVKKKTLQFSTEHLHG